MEAFALIYFAHQLISFMGFILYRGRWLWVCLLVIEGTGSFVLNRSFLRMAFGSPPALECPVQR
ncbi:hypothetical protein [Picosynechococcus sp. NKBG042902]|uniref:hypothetical protein n=1 Tax=Picosynechococcus sp. NKBG042902 TaxID=490193 RepID=UPI0004AB6F31|nr:hypothetical protein [Picosynechococcus sp. NKBG042902]